MRKSLENLRPHSFISGITRIQISVQICAVKSNMASSLTSMWSKITRNNAFFRRSLPILAQGLKTSTSCLGLEEFFPPGVLEKGELAPEEVKTGRRWRAGELRIKSNEDLQKLWYVLVKERNMLNTLKHEAKRQGVAMPSPERYYKVKKSMAAIKLVLGERERALRDLESQVWPFDKLSEEENNKDQSIADESSYENVRQQHPVQEGVVLNMKENKPENELESQSKDENPVLPGNLRTT